MTELTAFEKLYLNKKCFVLYNDRMAYNGIIISLIGNSFIIKDERIGAVTLPIEKCKIEIREGRT